MSRQTFILALVLFLATLFSGCQRAHLSWAAVDNQPVEAPPLQVDSNLLGILQPYRQGLQNQMEQVIGEVSAPLELDKPESTLGNWFADVLWEKAAFYSSKQVDFAVQNQGGIRISTLPAGPITVGKVFELMPFDNQLVVLEASGAIVDSLAQHIASKGGWPVSRRFNFTINAQGEAEHITISGQQLDPQRQYRFALPDFIANGGDRCFFLKPVPRENLGLLIRDLILEYLQEQDRLGKPLEAKLDQRIILAP